MLCGLMYGWCVKLGKGLSLVFACVGLKKDPAIVQSVRRRARDRRLPRVLYEQKCGVGPLGPSSVDSVNVDCGVVCDGVMVWCSCVDVVCGCGRVASAAVGRVAALNRPAHPDARGGEVRDGWGGGPPAPLQVAG